MTGSVERHDTSRREPASERLDADGVAVRFGERWVLTSASVSVECGRVTQVVGRNGAGKSTLLKVLCGVTRPVSGRVTVDGQVIDRPSLRRLAALGIWWWPQDGFLGPELRLLEHAKLLQARQADAVERFRSALDAFGLRRAIEMSRAGDCSPGERKMAEAALVEASGARFIIADEPFAGVAPTVTEALMTGLRRLTHGGAGACVSTHDLWVMQEFSSPMTWVTSGTTYQFASFQAAQREWAFTRDFLGHG